MYELTVETVFSAAHSLSIQGEQEPIHGHDWHVTACISGRTLDPDGMLVDFHAVEAALQELVRPFRNANLNTTPPFDRTNPSAEHVAAYLGQSLGAAVARLGDAPEGLRPRVSWVRVTEAPGCAVTYRTTEA